MSRKLKSDEAEWLVSNCHRPLADVRAEMVAMFGVSISTTTYVRYRDKMGYKGKRSYGQRYGVFTAPAQRIGPYGYVMERRVVDGRAKWVAKHKADWIDAHGPLPVGHRLICLGNKSNPDLSNWKCVPHGAVTMATLNSPIPLGTAHHDLKPALIALAEIKMKLKRK